MMKLKRFLVLLCCLLTVLGLCACGSQKDESDEDDSLVVFNYGDYIDHDVLDLFEEETGITVKYEQYITPEDMYTKFKSGGITYDVICTSDYMIQKMIQAGECQDVRLDEMTYSDNLDETYLAFCESFDEGNHYAVPYLWGTVGIIYNTTMVSEAPDSWEVFWDDTYADNLVVQNSMRDAFVLPLKLLGQSINTTDETVLRRAQSMLFDEKQYVMAYLVDEIRDVMIAGDAAIAEIYSGDATVAMEANPDLDYVLPKEGSNIWFDCWCIPANAKHVEAARKFIDFLCREDIAMMNFEYVYYGTPNKAVKEALDEETLTDSTIFPDEESLSKCEVYHYLGADMENLYSQMWKELKSY